MNPQSDFADNGLLIVTGSTPRAEQADRPLAYHLQKVVHQKLENTHDNCPVLVLSDLWYLNSESLQALPTISVGGPGVNAVSAHFYKRLANALIVEKGLIIQMDPEFQDLRACLWGTNHLLTVNAMEIFISNGYLEGFLGASLMRLCE